MKQIKIDLIGLDASAINIVDGEDGYYFMVGENKISLPPHHNAKSFSDVSEILTFFIDKLGDLNVGLILYFLTDLIKKQKVKNIRINNKEVHTESDMEDALKDG